LLIFRSNIIKIELKEAIMKIIKNDQIDADLIVPNDNLLTNEPGFDIIVKYLSIDAKLSNNALLCKEKYCRNKNILHV